MGSRIVGKMAMTLFSNSDLNTWPSFDLNSLAMRCRPMRIVASSLGVVLPYWTRVRPRTRSGMLTRRLRSFSMW